MSAPRINSTVVQLSVFALVAVVCLGYVGWRVLGGNPLFRSYSVTVRLADSAELFAHSEVTYRGVPVELLVAVPMAFSSLASIEHGGVADFDLVAAQGPVCYYPNDRRAPTETRREHPTSTSTARRTCRRCSSVARSTPLGPVPAGPLW